MTRQPEDRDWERIVEAVDLDIRPEDLRAAERAMEEARELDHEPVSPAWVAATLARVAHDGAVARDPEVPAQAIKPVLGGGWWQGVKRFAAALLALVGIQSAASAAVVGTAGVVAVTTVIVVWSGIRSTWTLSFSTALQILEDGDSDDGGRRSAINYLSQRIRDVALVLRELRDNGDVALQGAAREALKQLALAARGEVGDLAERGSAAAGAFPRVFDAVVGPDFGVSSRVEAIKTLTLVAAAGISGIRNTGPGSDDVRDLQQLRLAQLLSLLTS